ncbi:MAG: 16S rRNA processing protein RimM [Tenericutes bacterium]|jgi:16S rRNA processing protein RimM|nr:16S rRNA processing protein RimM [Mycoplasmatota bacterium]
MKYIYIGEIVNTHGIRGELKIKSAFKYKEKIFIPFKNIYIGDLYQKHTIMSYRKHKDYDMVLLDELNNINDVLIYKNKKVYIKPEDLKLNDNEYLEEDLIGFTAIIGKTKGKIEGIKTTAINYSCLMINMNNKIMLYPYKEELIRKIDFINKKIYLKYIEGLI